MDTEVAVSRMKQIIASALTVAHVAADNANPRVFTAGVFSCRKVDL